MKPAGKFPPITPRLLDIPKSAFYCRVGKQTIRDWYADGLIEPVPVPGAALRAKGGRIVSRPGKRRMAKLLFDVRDLDAFIDGLKGDGGQK
jgi:hypothetical protein